MFVRSPLETKRYPVFVLSLPWPQSVFARGPPQGGNDARDVQRQDINFSSNFVFHPTIATVPRSTRATGLIAGNLRYTFELCDPRGSVGCAIRKDDRDRARFLSRERHRER